MHGLFLNNAELSKSEIGEFLAGGKPFMKDVREAFSDLFDFTGMTFVASLREYLGARLRGTCAAPCTLPSPSAAPVPG